MAPVIECVPNFSEGKNPETLGALEHAMRSVPNAHLSDRHVDSWHNRSVFTIAGTPGPVIEAAFRATQVASQCIDLRKHRGVHPRMEATDVVPFVPLGDSAMELSIDVAHRFGQRVERTPDSCVFSPATPHGTPSA